MILSVLTFLPLAAGALVALLGPDRQKLGRNLAFAASLLALALAVWLWAALLGCQHHFLCQSAKGFVVPFKQGVSNKISGGLCGVVVTLFIWVALA